MRAIPSILPGYGDGQSSKYVGLPALTCAKPAGRIKKNVRPKLIRPKVNSTHPARPDPADIIGRSRHHRPAIYADGNEGGIQQAILACSGRCDICRLSERVNSNSKNVENAKKAK